jgi:hypothetical protein
VIVPSRSESNLKILRSYIPGKEDKLFTINEDIGDETGAENIKKAVLDKFGGIDHVVSALGSMETGGPATTRTLAEFNSASKLLSSIFLLKFVSTNVMRCSLCNG